MKIIACDIGGTEIKGALYNNGIQKEYKLKTDQSLGRDSVLQTLKNIIDYLMEEDVERIGIVTAGAIDIETGFVVSNAGTLKEWVDFSIKEELEKTYNLPTYIDNDANGALIGEIEEYKDTYSNIAMITLGTGVGTGLYINNEVYRGSTYQVEFGHMTLIPNGKTCTCGLKGCAECYLSGTALTELAIEKVDPNITHGKELFEYYKQGNQKAIEVLDEYTELLAIYINSINKFIDFELLIIGGGVITSKDILLPLLHEKLAKLNINKRIEPAKHLNTAGIKGAYLLALRG